MGEGGCVGLRFFLFAEDDGAASAVAGEHVETFEDFAGQAGQRLFEQVEDGDPDALAGVAGEEFLLVDGEAVDGHVVIRIRDGVTDGEQEHVLAFLAFFDTGQLPHVGHLRGVGRAALQEDFGFGPLAALHEGERGLLAEHFFGTGDGVLAAGGATFADRAGEAHRRFGKADCGAEFHHGLIEIAGALGVDEVFGGAAEFTAAGYAGDGLVAEVAGEDALDVAVDGSDRLAKSDRGNGCGGVNADAGKTAEGGGGGWNLALVFGDDGAGGLMQGARAAVVAEAAPEGEDFGFLGVSERLEGGKAGHEPGVVIDDDGDAGLLQHGLGDPDRVGIAGEAPRQFAGILIKPLQQILAEIHVFLSQPLGGL